jgi:hypothetical protein
MIAVPFLNLKQALYNEFVNKGINKNDIQESSLRLEFQIEDGKANYKLDTNAINGSSRTEVKLNPNDLFAFCGMQLGLIKFNPSLKNEALSPVQSYVNETFMGYTVPADAQKLEAIYNGTLSIKDGTTVKLDKYPTRNFREVSVTPQSTAANKSSMNGIYTGLALITPTFVIGKDQTEISLDFPTPAAGITWAHTVADTAVKGVLYLHGYILKSQNVKR